MAAGKQRPDRTPPPAPPRPLPAGLVARVPACGCCRRCGCQLVDTLPTADVWCAGCQVWTLATVAVSAPRQRRKTA